MAHDDDGDKRLPNDPLREPLLPPPGFGDDAAVMPPTAAQADDAVMPPPAFNTDDAAVLPPASARPDDAPVLPAGNTPIPASSPQPSAGRNLPWGKILRFGLPLLIFAGIGISQCGSTSADNIDVGACFAIPDDGTFTRVDDQDCNSPHEVQVYAEVTGIGSTAQEDACYAKLEPLIATFPFPDDTELRIITDEEDTNANVQCVLVSPSGQLVGSVLE